ncbi:FecR domain-containing protein [bacterium]|nr:FecR domain-containing protein [bacterium]
MVKKWSDLKLADEKELRRKKRELARKKKQNKEKTKKNKENAKLYMTIGGIVAVVIVFVLWIVIDFSGVSNAEAEKMKTVMVNSTTKTSKVYYADGTSAVNPKCNIERKIKMVETADGDIKLLLKDNTLIHLRKNSKVKIKILGVTSKLKLKVEVEVLKGNVFIKATDRSEFTIKTSLARGVNKKYCNFNMRLNIHEKDVEYLCEYGNFDIHYQNDKKITSIKPSQKIIFTSDGKKNIGSFQNFVYYE